MNLLVDQYGNEYRRETPNLFSAHCRKAWSRSLLMETQKPNYFEKFIGPMLVDQYGNKLGDMDVLPSKIQVNR